MIFRMQPKPNITSRQRRLLTVVALLIVILGAVTPDEYFQERAAGSPGPPVVAASHSSDDPAPSCDNDENCFCCAHFVPVPLFVFVGLWNEMILPRSNAQDLPLGGTVHPPYLPPRA